MNRREILKGIALGSSSFLLNPILSQIQAHASGQPITNKRFVFVLESNGVKPSQMAPEGIMRSDRPEKPFNGPAEFIDIPLHNRKLPMSLQPIDRWKDRVTILQGLSGRICGGGHSNDHGALGAVPGGRKGPASVHETIDAALSKALPSIFPFVGLGISKSLDRNIVYSISAWDTGKLLPIVCDPQQAYNTLFGSIADGSAKEEFIAKNNLLDFLKDDIKKLEAALVGQEKEQFSAYLQSFESLRNRQSRLNDIEHTLREKGPVVNDKYRSKVEIDRLDAQFDIAAASLICGLTNVVTISSAAGELDFDITFSGLGIKRDKHQIGHGGSDGNRTYLELYDIIRRWHFDRIAELMSKLEQVPEGDGTMLDNTVIIYLSDNAEAHHSRCWEWPMVVIGDMGGKLKSGRYIDYPGYGQPKHRTTANMYLTLLELAGAPRETFGKADPTLADLDQHGPLEELLT